MPNKTEDGEVEVDKLAEELLNTGRYGVNRHVIARDIIELGYRKSALVPLSKNTLADALKSSAQAALEISHVSFYRPSRWPVGVHDFYLEVYSQMMDWCAGFGTAKVLTEKQMEEIMHKAFFKAGLREMNPYDAKRIKEYAKALHAAQTGETE